MKRAANYKVIKKASGNNSTEYISTRTNCYRRGSCVFATKSARTRWSANAKMHLCVL